MLPLSVRSLPIATAFATASVASGAQSPPPKFYSEPQSRLPFSPAVRAGDFIFLSGQIGTRSDGSLPSTIGEQTRLAMQHIQDALGSAGASVDDLIKCTVMLRDMEKWDEFNQSYAAFFKSGRLPARSAFGATSLARGADVEIECLAYKPL